MALTVRSMNEKMLQRIKLGLENGVSTHTMGQLYGVAVTWSRTRLEAGLYARVADLSLLL
jgi:hypothetical protein